MDIEKYCQCFLSSITLRGLSFPKDQISSFPHPRHKMPFYRELISRMEKFQKFSNISVFDKEKTFRKKTKVFNSNVFDTFAIKRVYHIGKLPITYEEAWKLPLRSQQK